MAVSNALMSRIRDLYPWMNTEMLNAYTSSWTTYESGELALQDVRKTSSYRSTFQGNYDPDTGLVRMSEADYFASKSRFDATLESVGLNPTYFEDEWLMALEGDVSPSEMVGRMEAAYERVALAAPEIRRYYAENFNIELSNEAILASAISPRIGEEILNRRIAVAEIGGTALQRGFNIGEGFAEELVQQGLNMQGAQEFFGTASAMIPAMEVLAQRHADPDDDFDLNDVKASFLYDDPETRRRIRRVVAQERAGFTGGAQVEFRRSRSGGAGGLSEV